MIFTSNHFLSGSSGFVLPESPGLYQHIKCKLCTLDELLTCLESVFNNEIQTAYTDLDQRLLDTRVAFGSMHQNVPQQFKQSIGYYRESITNITDSSPQLVDFCKKLAKYLPANDQKEGLFWAIQAIVSQHADSIVKARVLTLSKRDGFTELILKIYDTGLFPFGWNLGEYNVFVFNPKDLQ
jgi:hypothetical protein